MSVSLTNVLDVVLDADGTPAHGRVVVYWPMFMVDGVAVTQGQRSYEIDDGQIDLSLYPTVSAQPNGSYYTATFELNNGSVYDEYWVIPNQTNVKLNQIRAMFPPAPGLFINSLQITGGGAQNGQFLGWNGTQWVPMYVTTLNVSPNFINFALSSTPSVDLSVLGSPVTLGGVVTINVPDAGPFSRGVVTTGPQTFAGAKTFADPVVFNSAITLSPFVPVNPQWGQVWFDFQNVFHLNGSLQLNLPTAAPAIGSQQLWADPADGYRVKWAA